MTETIRYPYVHVTVDETDEVSLLQEELFELGATGVEQRDSSTMSGPDRPQAITLVASFSTEANAFRARDALSDRYAVEQTFLEGDDWKHAWKRFFRASDVGRRLWVAPPWDESERDPARLEVRIDPGMAFGTGTHESTLLVLSELDRWVQGGETVLDMGTGTGILSIAALKLGALCALGVDVDADAVAAAAENAEVNGVAAHFRVRQSADVPAGRFNLVLANIRTAVLLPMAPTLASALESGGHLMLSGILADEADEVETTYAHRLARVHRRAMNRWVSLTFERKE